MENLSIKKYSTQELEDLFYAVDVGEFFNKIVAELKRRYDHKRILAGLKI